MLALLWSSPAHAQQSLQDILSFLLTNQAVQTGDFVKDTQSMATTRDTITQLLLVDLTTQPLTSSSAGFNYKFNKTLGTMERSTPSFGPFFTERSVTAGKYDVSMGLTVQMSHYASLDHHDLRDGTFVTTANQFRDETQPFDVETLTLRINSRTATLWGNFGVTDRFDLGFAVPLVSLTLEGSRVNTYRGAQELQATALGHATGLGDVAVRSKFGVVSARQAALAVLGEVRLPTGRREDLLGAGRPSARGMLAGSVQSGPLAFDANGGWSVGGLSSELTYRAATSISTSSRMTLVGELLGRRLNDIGNITEGRVPHPTIADVDTIRLITTGTATHTAGLVLGLKWNVLGMWLINANVALPLTGNGLRAPVVPTIGLDYAFGG
jgi:hypothetical protein